MRQFTPLAVTVPARTAKAAPVTVAWPLYPGWVHNFRIDIPAGHGSLTGVRVAIDGTPVIPFHSSLFLVGDGRSFTVPFEDEVDQFSMTVQAYNTDAYPHVFYLWADVNPYGPRNQLAPLVVRPAGFVPRTTADAIAALARTTGAA